MFALLKIEWLKLKNYRTFWILSSLYIVSVFGANYIVYRIQQEIFREQQAKGMAEMIVGSIPYEFPTVWQMTSHVSSYLLFIPGLIMIISVTNEYSFKTHRQNIIDGWSRKQFISIKIMQAVLWAALSTFLVFLSSLIFGLQGKEGIDFSKAYFLGYSFIQALSYIMVALLFAILFRRGGLAIGVFFVYALLLDELVALLLNRYVYDIGRYMPLESVDKLVTAPVFENLKRRIVAPPNYALQFSFAIAYLIGYFVFITKKFEKDDL
jgi:ABC-type transport system involved in multi-copper enzyme maturation permease subunit